MSTLSTSLPGGTWTLGDSPVTRFGYGAMQLAGPGVMGPPADHDGALAVLLQRSPNILLIPGTSSVAHLRENIVGARLALSDEDVAELNRMGR